MTNITDFSLFSSVYTSKSRTVYYNPPCFPHASKIHHSELFHITPIH